MERNAHYALVGAVAAVLLLGLLVFVVWLARVQFAAQYTVYDVDFKGPVRGLSSGGEVYFNGIKVGEVTKLSLDRRDPDRVVARVRTSADAPVKTDSYASLEPQGVTGVSYIQIAAGSPNAPLLRDVTPEGQIPVIRSREGALESLLQGGGDVLARSVEALDRVNSLLSDQNLKAFSQTLGNVRDATALVKDQRRLLADLDTTVKSLTVTSGHIDELAQTTDTVINGQGRKTLTDLSAAADELKGAASDARTLAAKLQSPASNFAANGLPQLSRTAASLQTAAESLNRLVGEVERNPRALLAKPPAKTREVQP
jgi:phospholipid/cholesterol/gamma-HCH transport system substrate-binding protein